MNGALCLFIFSYLYSQLCCSGVYGAVFLLCCEDASVYCDIDMIFVHLILI